MSFTTATAKGRRPYQEDRFITASFTSESHPDRNGILLAVFDGHGGETCSEFLAEHFIPAFTTYYQESEPKRAMRQAISQMFKVTNGLDDGSTGSFIFIPTTGPAIVAIVGDSPIIIGTKRGYHLSPEHNARTNIKEREAAEERGAVYMGGYLQSGWSGPGLQMSRAFGDASLRFLKRTPQVYSHPVLDFVVVGTDGILDPGHNSADGKKMLEGIVAAVRNDCDAQFIVDMAVALPTHDNATAILWRRDAEGQK